MAGRRQGDGGGRGLVRVEPGDVEPVRALHRHPFATGPLVVLGDGEDQVAELAEARVGAVGGSLAVVEGDRPATERDRRRGAALRPDHAGRPGRGAHPDEPALDDDDAADAARPGEHGRPATDRPGPDDHQVSPIRRHRHASSPLAHDSRARRRGGCSSRSAARSAVERRRLHADRHHAETCQAVERRPATDGVGDHLQAGRRGALDRTAVERTPVDGQPATAERERPRRPSARRGRALLSQRGQSGRSRPTRSSAGAIERRHDRPVERRAPSRRRGPRPRPDPDRP